MNADEMLLKAVRAGGGVVAIDGLWYVVAAGLLWLGFYVLFRQAALRRKVVARFPSRGQMGWEAACSLRSILVFGVVTVAVQFAGIAGYTRQYHRIDAFGWWWFALSIPVAVVIHDAYFYWTHRLMHVPLLFRLVHRTHHRSVNPTPWAAYSFSLGEAFVQAGIGPLLVFTMPMHGLAFLAFMTIQIGFNVLGHCGYEIFPRWFLASWAGKLLNTPTHHALHHEKFRGNYGLYFNVWDRLMGTNRPDYQQRFEAAAGGAGVDNAPVEQEKEARKPVLVP